MQWVSHWDKALHQNQKVANSNLTRHSTKLRNKSRYGFSGTFGSKTWKLNTIWHWFIEAVDRCVGQRRSSYIWHCKLSYRYWDYVDLNSDRWKLSGKLYWRENCRKVLVEILLRVEVIPKWFSYSKLLSINKPSRYLPAQS